MSKKGFKLSQGADNNVEEVDPDIQIKKVSRVQANGQEGQGKEGGGTSKSSYSFTGVAPGKTYIHPPSRLTDGRVMYPCKYLGHLRVPEPRGSKLVQDAIDKLLTVAAVNKTNLDEDLKDVDLSISIRSLVTVDKRTKKALHQHPLPLVSYSADDKRGAGNMFAYISRGKPPATEHLCYVYQCSATQAKEITATVGQAFELAYKKFLETKQAQEDFKKLVQMLKTATPEEKVEIEKKLVEVNKIRGEEAERQRRMAAIQAKMPDPYVKPITKINIKGTQGAGLYTGSGKESSAMFNKGEEDTDKIEKEVKQLEIESERQRQSKKMQRATSSVEAKWENITMALEPFQMEPSLDPETQYLVKQRHTRELDSAITDIEVQIQDLEDAFDWRRRKGQGPVPNLYDYEEEKEEKPREKTEEEQRILDSIDGQVWLAKLDADSIEIPDLPANYVMDEFVKAREQAAMPSKGSVKSAAKGWYEEHHD